MNNNDTILYPIAFRGFSSNSLFTVATNIEVTTQDNRSFATDVVFLTFKAGRRVNGKTAYDKSSELSAKINTIKLRALSYGIKSAVKKVQKGIYEGLYYNRTANSEYFISSKDNGKLYINIRDLKNTNHYIGVEVEQIEFYAFADVIELMARVTEEHLYSYQRKLKFNRQQES